LFGTELVVGNVYSFTGTKAAIYTWEGCRFEVSGDAVQSDYVAQETPMTEYINVHFALDSIRQQAKAAGKEGPRLLIIGPEGAGKTTLAKILTGYAVRALRSPVVVNLNVKESVMSVPGTLTATVFKSMIDVEEGWGTAPMSGPNGAIPVKLPLVYFYGSEDPFHKDSKVYKTQVSRLALSVTGRLSQDPEAREGGVIVDTPSVLGSSGALNADLLAHVVSEFAVNYIVCIGSERLYSEVSRRYDNQPVSMSATSNSCSPTISVVKLTKSEGCVDRDSTYMTAFRTGQIRTYFYGNPRLSNGVALQPRQQTIDYSTLTVWQRLGTFAAGALAGAPNATAAVEDDEFLPGDFAPDVPAVTSNGSAVPLPASQIFERITAPQPAMRGCLFAVMNCAPEAEQDTIRDSSVMGFLYVVDVDDARGKISLLSPVAGRVPDRALVWAGWPEGVLGLKD
jgi:polyribonucleotide 5'-hydroxyl-kinase